MHTRTFKGTPAPPRRTLRFKNVSSSTTQCQGTEARDPLAATRPGRGISLLERRNPRRHERALLSNLSTTLTSLSFMPRRRGRQADENRQDLDFEFASFHMQDPYLQELAASAPQKRNWKGILTAFAMILLISSIILAVIFFFTPCEFQFIPSIGDI